MHGGRYRITFEEAEALRGEELEWERFLVTYVGAESAIDLGQHDRAKELLADLYLLSTTGYERLPGRRCGSEPTRSCGQVGHASRLPLWMS